MNTIKRFGIIVAVVVASLAGFAGCDRDASRNQTTSVDSPSVPSDRYDGPDSDGNGRWNPSPLDPYQS
jgi:hypothetical protein